MCGVSPQGCRVVNDRLAMFVFAGLNTSVPRGAPDVQQALLEVDVCPLEAEHFAGAHSGHGQEPEHGFVGLSRCRNDFADFLHCEESSFGLDLFGRNGEALVVHDLAYIAPAFCGLQNRGQRAQPLRIIFRDRFAWASFVTKNCCACTPFSSRPRLPKWERICTPTRDRQLSEFEFFPYSPPRGIVTRTVVP